MAILFNQKRHSLSLVEIVLSVTLLALTLPTLAVAALKLSSRFQYSQDISRLKNQLQMAHDMTLHTHVPAKIKLRMTSKGLLCSLSFENKDIEKQVLSQQVYKHIRFMKDQYFERSSLNLYCSSSGGLTQPKSLTFQDTKKKYEHEIVLKGYPHVVYATQKK